MGVVRVLVVDDNADAADSLADLLGYCGYEAAACHGGDEALAAVAGGFVPAAALLDLDMPGVPGDVLGAALRERLHARPPVLVAVTARDDPAARAGFAAHVVKPADPAELLALLAPLDGG